MTEQLYNRWSPLSKLHLSIHQPRHNETIILNMPCIERCRSVRRRRWRKIMCIDLCHKWDFMKEFRGIFVIMSGRAWWISFGRHDQHPRKKPFTLLQKFRNQPLDYLSNAQTPTYKHHNKGIFVYNKYLASPSASE